MTYKKLLPVVVLSVVLRLYIAWVFPLGGDEGVLAYDSMVMSSDNMPFRDYMSRDAVPVLLYHPLTYFHSLYVMRLLSIAFAVVASYFVYLIGKELFSERTGLLASAVFLLEPFSLFQLSPVMAQSIVVLLITSSVYSLLKKRWYAAGVLIGLGVFAKLAMLHLMGVALAIMLLRKDARSLPKVFAGMLLVAAAMCLVFTPKVVTNSAGFTWFSARVHSTTPSTMSNIMVCLGTLYQLLSRYSFIFLGGMIYLISLTRKRIKIPITISFIAAATVFVLLMTLRPSLSFITIRSHDVVQANYWRIIFVPIFLATAFLWSLNKAGKLTPNKNHLILIAWLLISCSQFIILLKWHTYYLVDLIPPLAIMSALAFEKYGLKTIILLLYLTSLIMAFTHPVSNAIQLRDVTAASAYIKNQGYTGEVFTGNPAYNFETNTRITLNMSHPNYIEDPTFKIRDPTTIDKIREQLKTGEAKYAVVDPLTEEEYPETLKTIIYPNYQKVAEYGRIRVYKYIE